MIVDSERSRGDRDAKVSASPEMLLWFTLILGGGGGTGGSGRGGGGFGRLRGGESIGWGGGSQLGGERGGQV